MVRAENERYSSKYEEITLGPQRPGLLRGNGLLGFFLRAPKNKKGGDT